MGPKSERNVLKVKKGHVKVQTERRLQGAENIVKAKGHGMKGAYQVASSNKDLSAAVDMKGSFWATTSKASRDIKRGEVMKLAKMLESAEDNVFPLSHTLVEKVAACLKASNMKSGDQYLNELKLRHVEEGHDLPPWLIRPFSMCKKALTRCKGPTKRALEAKLEGISDDAWAATKRKAGEGIDPVWSYAWACLWMLREIEASNCKWEHVRADGQAKQVSLNIPISKMDQSALGVKGTLQCCGESPCSRFCAWGVWQILVSAVPQERHRKGHIFVDEKGNKLTRAKMIEGWKKVTGKDVTGHSARRSGAMEYIRRGLQIQELAFLGRWKSAVVLTYANDALQDVPANRNIPGEARALVISCPKTPWGTIPCPSTPCTPAPNTPCGRKFHEQVEGDVEVKENAPKVETRNLWVASCDTRGGRRTWHRVTKAGWQIAMSNWNTACGWNFTRNPEKVMMSASLQVNQGKCRKCIEVMKTRDVVKEGRRLAGFMEKEAIQMFGL